jgi:hypothetical protein
VFRVRAVDNAGNTGAWATGSVLTPRLVQDSSKAITYRGEWSKRESREYSGETVRSSRHRGASATIRATGRSFALVTTKAPNRGRVSVYVNGALRARINLDSATTRYRQVVWQTSWSSATAPVIQVRVERADGRPRVDVDAFVVID